MLRSSLAATVLLLTSLVTVRAHGEISAGDAWFFPARDISVDGYLDESAWLAAAPLTQFFETYPRVVADPVFLTEARFLYDDKYVYIGVTAYDPDPTSVRSGFVRRDSVSIDQDYIEVMLDPLSAERNALIFRANPSGIVNDGQFNEREQLIDTRLDLNFDAATSVNERDWQVEFRIPIDTLRYRAGHDQSWRFVISRNRPRKSRMTIQSSPEPRHSICKLCFAGTVRGISIEASKPPAYVTPQLTYAHGDASDEIRGSVDAKWIPRSNTVVDLTIWPDFSQVEADDLQLTANAQFALAVKEKRPFFLEGTDLFSTPITAIYTRSFAEPQAGIRITHRGDASDYSALILRNQSGGIHLEPGVLESAVLTQPFDSTAMVARYKQEFGDLAWSVLASARVNDSARGGGNYVYGVDGAWSPTTSDRVSVQVLASATTNPDRPDLLPSWDGRHFDGTGYALAWEHSSDKWYATLLNSNFSNGFRAWNGFVPQVDVSSLTAETGLFFYPDSELLSRISAGINYVGVRQLGGSELTVEAYPSLSLTMPFSTELTVSFSPNARNTSFAGLRTYRYWSVAATTTPAAWMPGVSVITSFGDGIDFTTGDVTKATSVLASVPLRLFGHLEVVAGLGYQAQESRANSRRSFTQQNLQLDALWHFSSKLYLQAQYQKSRLTSNESPSPSYRESQQSIREGISALLSYQSSWQTRYFVGVRHSSLDGSPISSNATEIFAKVSYALSNWN